MTPEEQVALIAANHGGQEETILTARWFMFDDPYKAQAFIEEARKAGVPLKTTQPFFTRNKWGVRVK